jgi:hypothetical protein
MFNQPAGLSHGLQAMNTLSLVYRILNPEFPVSRAPGGSLQSQRGVYRAKAEQRMAA